MVDEVVGRRAGRVGAGSQQALRTANTRRVLDCLTDHGPMTQAALSRVTGLSAATVSNIVARLRGEGLAVTTPTTASGRRAMLVGLSIPPHPKVAAGVDFGRRHLRVVLASLGREVLAEQAIELPAGHAAEEGIVAAADLLAHLLGVAGLDREDVIGCGVGIPGPIDARTGRVGHGAILPEWVGFRPEDRLRDALGLPVYVDNDANLGALAETTWGPYVDAEHLVYLKVATGIGAGVVIDGRVHRGAMGITGEVGHFPLVERGGMCRCGNRGCLETVASTSVMVAELARSGLLPGPASTAELVRLVLDGDPAARRVVEDAAQAIGRVVAAVVNLVNPSAVVIGGPLVPLGEVLLPPVRRGLQRFATPAVGPDTLVAVSTLGDRGEALGACSLAFQQTDPGLLFADAAVPG